MSYEYSQNAQKYFKKKKYGTAVKFLEKSIATNKDQAVREEMQQLIGDMKSHYFKTCLRGLNIGLLVSIPAVAAIIYFLIDKLPVIFAKDIQNLVDQFSEYSMYLKSLLIFLYVAFMIVVSNVIRDIFRKPKKKMIQSDSLRWKIGFFGGLAASFIGLVVIKLLYETGIPVYVIDISRACPQFINIDIEEN